MKNLLSIFAFRQLATVLVVAAALSACAPKKAADHESFATPEAAVDSFVAALEKDDTVALRSLLGPGTEDLLSSGDPVQDKGGRTRFLDSYKQKHALVTDGDQRTLVVGDDDWPFPIPVVQRDGRWFLDGAAGADELVYRRVGRNELGAIAVSRGFVDAQIDYAAAGRDGDPAGIYALKLISDPGMHNGLYWPDAEGEAQSPVGPFVAAAAAEGYRAGARKPYHGYFYRMLYRQGSHANGGARDYFKDGLLTNGFALIAWPADHGASGVMTFMVDQDGVVFQKDLGDDTDAKVAAIDTFDPDSSWVAVTDE